MEYKEIIEQLQILNEHQELWEDYIDIKTLDEAMDIIYDYGEAVGQARRLTEKYETTKDAIERGMGTWQCPTCQKLISFGNEHCHWCGQKLGWRPNAPRRGGRGRCKKY